MVTKKLERSGLVALPLLSVTLVGWTSVCDHSPFLHGGVDASSPSGLLKKGQKMAQFKAALVREQGVTFAVVLVKNHVLNCSTTADQMIQSVSAAMGCSLVVLMGESNRKLRGSRQDVVNFVSRIHPSRLPWKTWTI
jgi:hypothetical protein